MDDARDPRTLKQPCSVQGCPGHYETRLVVHAARRQGRVVVINDVPAEVCDVCGDTIYTLETSEHISAIFYALDEGELEPDEVAPVLQFAA